MENLSRRERAACTSSMDLERVACLSIGTQADIEFANEGIDVGNDERLAALEAKVQELVDRQAIFDCIKRNSRGNDRFDVELVTSSYHPDAIHELGLKQISGREYGEHANNSHRKLFEATLHNVTMHTCQIDG